MQTHLLKFILLNLCLVLFNTTQAQTHEVGIHGGWLTGYNAGRDNTSTMTGGWTAGGYYRYTVNRWVGAEGGVDYSRKRFIFYRQLWENSISVPVSLVVFPKFRFSLFGGMYMKNRLGLTTLKGGNDSDTNREPDPELKKRPAWGYHAGIKWNMKYFRFVVSCQQDLTSWVADFSQIQGWLYQHPIKSFYINLTAEIPLWRNRK